VSNTYIYDGKDMYLLDNVNGRMIGIINKDTPLRLTSLDYINMPAFCFGYDIDGINTLAKSLKNDKGKVPVIQKVNNSNGFENIGTFPDSKDAIKLSTLSWKSGNEPPFEEATYLQPKYNVVVKILNRDFSMFDGIEFPTSVEILVRHTSNIHEFETSDQILRNTITVLDAQFDSAQISEEEFLTTLPVGYTTGH
jgi:hypothetical protein